MLINSAASIHYLFTTFYFSEVAICASSTFVEVLLLLPLTMPTNFTTHSLVGGLTLILQSLVWKIMLYKNASRKIRVVVNYIIHSDELKIFSASRKYLKLTTWFL